METDHQREVGVAWAAGLFDGEGCVRVNASGAKVLTLEMLDKEAPLRMYQLFGGQFYIYRRRDNRVIYRWYTSAQTTVQALQAMLPYLVTKAREARVLLRYAAFQGDNGVVPHARRSARTNKELQRARDELSRLKRRGPGVPRRAIPSARHPGPAFRRSGMPAKSKAQLRKAGAACGRGAQWGCEMVEKTGSAKDLPERKGKGKHKRMREARHGK